MPSSNYDPSRSGFENEEEAWTWIIVSEEEGLKFKVSHPYETSCGAEWEICKTSELEKDESYNKFKET